MAGESQQVPDTQADPTVLTTEALARGLLGERDYQNAQRQVILERLNGIDKATELLSATVNRVPTDTQKEISHLDSLVAEKFASVQTQFRERDTRQERESKDNKVAVDAAFAAQKEAAAKQDEANAKAIDKSERATAETIKSNQELGKATTDAQAKQLDAIGTRLTTLEAHGQGGADATKLLLSVIAAAGVIVGILGAAGVFTR